MADIPSTLIYLMIFLITIFASYIMDGYEKKSLVSVTASKKSFYSGKNNAVEKIILALIIILLPSILAGIRADTVGVDIKVYITQTFDICKNASSFVDALSSTKSEFLFVTISYISAKLFDNVGILLFVIQLFTMIPIYKITSLYKGRIPRFLIISVYMFVFFNNSLNIMRQSVACAWIILAYLYTKRGIKGAGLKIAVFCIIAVGFHSTSFVYFALLFGFDLLIKLIKKKSTWILYVIGAFAAVIVISINLQNIALWLLDKGIISSDYYFYIRVFFNKENDLGWFINPFSAYSLFEWICRLSWGLIPLIVMHTRKRIDNEFNKFSLLYFFGFAIYSFILFGMNTMYGGRLTLQTDFFSILLLPHIPKSKHDSFGMVLLFCLIFVYWYVFIMCWGWSGSNIYEFRFM